MKKTKIRLLVIGILATTITTSTPVFATTNTSTSNTGTLTSVQLNKTTTSSGVSIGVKDDLSTKDLSSIKENINSILSSKYEIMKTRKSKNYSNIIGDSKLLELVSKTNELNVKFFKSFKTKIDTYTSNVTVINSTKTATNTYVLNVLYDVEFNLHGMNVVSQSKNEEYKFEVEYKNDKWYIIKMVDLNDTEESDDISVNNKISGRLNTSDISNKFLNYDNSINSQIESIDDKSKNIDKYCNYFKQSQLVKANTSKLSRSNYHYDTDKAVSYACSYAEHPNPAYRFYGTNGDCTNFVSQCVNYGGIPTNPGVWMPGQYCWNTVVGFYNYMINNGYATSKTWTNGARVGDVVQWYKYGEWGHSVILTGSSDEDGSWVYCSHSNNRKNFPLYATFTEARYTDMRTIAFWH